MDLYSSTDQGIVVLISEKIRSRRVAMNLTQRQLAVNAGVSLSSVQAIERGQNTSLITLVQLLRALHCLNLLDALTTPDEISPIVYAEMLKKTNPPKRVRNRNSQEPTKYESEW